jgi:hypothetical protein
VVAFNKSGHTSILNAFSCSASKFFTDRGERSLEGVQRATWPDINILPNPVITLAYFRHPLIRIASVYNYFFLLAHEGQSEPSPIEDLSVIVQKTEFRESLKKMGFEQSMSFGAFCRHLSNTNLSDDLHLKRQAESFRQCCGITGDIWLGRLEELDRTWPYTIKTLQLDCTPELPHFNEKKYNWVKFYEDHATTADLVLELYKDDLRFWQELNWFETGKTIPSVSFSAP